MAKITITKNGPYLVSGNLPLKKEIITADTKNHTVKWGSGSKFPDKKEYALCRCGKSSNKPYCDGTHASINFNGKETASKDAYVKQAKKIVGPELILMDAVDFCFGAGFCHHQKGDVWELTKKSNDKNAKQLAIEEACNCPSGRLVMIDKKTNQVIEPKLKPEISLIEQQNKGVSGPIWVKGQVEIESWDKSKYETRNRVTLCRCGKSKNKPFCDGTHVDIEFRDDE